jgi:hypothetical protein
MDSLIGGPLTAACDAQIKLANATADFIKFVGFMPPPQGTKIQMLWGKPRTALFKFKRPVTPMPVSTEIRKPLPAPDIREGSWLEVPMLAIVHVPSEHYHRGRYFDMEVKSSFTSAEKTDAEAAMSADVTVGWGISKQGSYQASILHKENTRSSDNSAKYHVAVHAEDRGHARGLARVMDILPASVLREGLVNQRNQRRVWKGQKNNRLNR